MASTKGQGHAVIPEVGVVESITAAADGAYTGAIAQDASSVKVVAVTSAGATHWVTLPKAAAEYIGRVIFITVGSNGYELVTPSASGDTVNGVDCDGTNQLDVAASSTLRCTQVSATGWVAEQITATAIAVVAPDND